MNKANDSKIRKENGSHEVIDIAKLSVKGGMFILYEQYQYINDFIVYKKRLKGASYETI